MINQIILVLIEASGDFVQMNIIVSMLKSGVNLIQKVTDPQLKERIVFVTAAYCSCHILMYL